MFKFLKEKLQSWTKKIAKEETPEAESPKKIPEKKKGIQKNEKKTVSKKVKRSKEELEEERKVSEAVIEDIKQEEAAKEKEVAKKGFFQKLKEKFTTITISAEDFETYESELEFGLLENNVALEVAEEIIKGLKAELVGKSFESKDVEKIIKKSLEEKIEALLLEPFDVFEKIKESQKPYVLLCCGINGSGKTTTIAKLATLAKKKKCSVVLVAGDTFRAASIEQLKVHGKKIGVEVIAQRYGADPAAVAFDGIQYAKTRNIDLVLIDTAGRMHTAQNLLREMEKIVRVAKPNLKLFIGESITGNDCIDQAKAFNDAIGIDGIILSKADVDEKGGTALSIGSITKKPVLFLGTGQEYDDLEIFDKKKFIEKLGL